MMDFEPRSPFSRPPEQASGDRETNKPKQKKRRSGFGVVLPIAERLPKVDEVKPEVNYKSSRAHGLGTVGVEQARPRPNNEARPEQVAGDAGYELFERQKQPADTIYMGELLISHDDEQESKTKAEMPANEPPEFQPERTTTDSQAAVAQEPNELELGSNIPIVESSAEAARQDELRQHTIWQASSSEKVPKTSDLEAAQIDRANPSERPAAPETAVATSEKMDKAKLSSARALSEQVPVPPDRRVETSAWHRIEIDTKTGKAVENPTLAYGPEYYRERSHEIEPVDNDVQTATGGVALVAATTDDKRESGSLPSMASVTTQNLPDESTKLPPLAPQVIQRSTSRPTSPTWPYVVALIVVIIAIIVALF